MKKKLLWIVTVLPMLVTAVVLRFMPDRIPMHYDLAGNIDRWGSKYENFIFPVIIIVMTIFWCAFMRFFKKQQTESQDEKKVVEAKNNEKIIYYVAVGMALMFGIMHYFFMYSAYMEAKHEMNTAAIDINIVVNVLLGLFMIIIGNMMPKSRRNSTVGLRTTWSMYNDQTWQKSNRFGGKMLMAAGVLIIIEAFIFSGMLSVGIMLGILIISACISVVYSYKVYKEQNVLKS